MHSKTLVPRAAAQLAEQVYAVNEGSKERLEDFLSHPLFSGTIKELNADVGGRIIRSAEDGFGVCARGKNKRSNDIFLVFRGTTTANNKADFVTDARIGLTRSNSNYPAHIGFSHTFKSMRNDISRFIEGLKKEGMVIDGVHCIGHSLGGAVATLAAEWAYNHVSKNVMLYTFGQPRVGLALFSSSLTRKLGKENIHRVFHTTDPVPMVPAFPYVHCPLPGAGHKIASEALVTSGAAHKMALYLDDVSGKNWTDLERAAPVFSHERAIEEWLNSNRNQNPNCPKTFEWLESAIVWLLKKVLAKVVNIAQLAIMGVHTFVDMLAWALAKGIEIGENTASYVTLFMKKVMRILNIPVSKNSQNPTKSFFRFLLNQLIRRANELAVQALKNVRTR